MKIPDAVKLAARVLCDPSLGCKKECVLFAGARNECGWDKPIGDIARRILAAWRKPAPRTTRRGK